MTLALNPSQAAAALEVTRHVLVAAGAGTGKTQCVVGRLLYALGEEVAGRRLEERERLDLGEVAAITFTNVAAADLQRKLREALRAAGRRADAERVDTARIGTIHAFCGQVLREFALQLDRAPGLHTLEEAESVALAAESAREVLLEALEVADLPGLERLLEAYEVEKVLGWAARLAADADRLAALEGDGDADERERVILALARRTLTLMRRRLDERSALDFDSMITLVRDLLRDRPDVRRVLQRRIRLLVIDEFQDVDPAQQEIAWLLGISPGLPLASGLTSGPPSGLTSGPPSGLTPCPPSGLTPCPPSGLTPCPPLPSGDCVKTRRPRLFWSRVFAPQRGTGR
jgi:DNA helicase-2/ATP-dependent DNA helicase PcrA